MKILVSGFYLVQPYWVATSGWRVISAILFLNWSLMSGAFAQNKLWDKTIGGNSDDYFTSLQPTWDGGYILGGWSYSSKSGDKSGNNKGGWDYWVVKLKADGSKEWDKTIGGNDSDILLSVQQTSDGGYILGGYSWSSKSNDKTGNSKGNTDYWVVKLKADGSKVWDKTLGGNGSDVLVSLWQTKDGGYILGGNSDSGLSGDKSQASKGGDDYWIVKLQADGSKLWDRTLGSRGSDGFNSLQITSDGGYIVGGNSSADISGDKSQDSKGNNDYWLVKLQADGSKQWDKAFGGNAEDRLTQLQTTSDGGYIVGGYSSSDISGDKSQDGKGDLDYWVLKLKADGTLVWNKTIGGNSQDVLVSLQQTSDGSYILGGSSYSSISGNKTQANKGGMDYWIVKLAADGSVAWDKTIGGNSEDNLAAIYQNSEGNYLLAGHSYSNKSADKSQANKGGYDYWVVQLDNSGTNLNQIVTFPPLLYKNLDDAPLILSARSSSGLPMTYTIVSGPATISNGNVLTYTGVGTVTVKAMQVGNTTYLPAEVTRSFVVEPPSVVKRQWDKTLGGNNYDQLTSVHQTRDKGYILGGLSHSGRSGDKTGNSKGNGDYWIAKLKADGTKEWDKTYGGNNEDILASVQQTSDGGYIMVGSSSTSINGDKSEANRGSGYDYWIIKIKADGSKEWDQTIGGKSYDWLVSLQQTRDGGYILGGHSISGIGSNKTEASRGSTDYWVVKLRASGTKEWDRTFGGRYEDLLSSVQQTSDGGYILGGTSLSGISGDKTQARIGSTDYWVVKLQADGTKIWDKTIGGTDEDYLASLQLTSDGGYILGGYSWSGISGDKTQPSKGSHDYWLVKLQADGSKDWDKTIGGSESDVLTTLQQTSDGGYILGGNSYSNISGDKSQAPRGAADYDYWVVKLKADGSKAWDKTLGSNNNDVLVSVQETSDGEYILAGNSDSGVMGDKSESSRGGTDYWIVKIKEETILKAVWTNRFGGAGNDNFTVAIRTSDGGYLSGGYTNSGNSGDKTQNSEGKNDYWIVKSDKNGQKLWDKRYGGAGEDYLNRIIQTPDGGYLLGGSSLSGKSGDKTQDSQGERDYWVVKIDKQGNQQWDKTYGGNGSDELRKIVPLASGEYVLGGYSNSSASGDKSQDSQGGNDYWLVKIKADGTKLWDKRYGGTREDLLGSFIQTLGGGFFLAGSSESGQNGDKTQASRGGSDFWVVQTDKDGNLLWDKSYGGSGQDELYSVGRTKGDNLFLAGTSSSGANGDKSQASQGGKDYWMIKLDEHGIKQWDRTFGGSEEDELRASTFTNEGHYVLAGHSNSGAGGDKSQASQGSSDYWIVQVNEKGDKVVDQRYGGSGEEELRSVFQTSDGGLLLAGRSSSGVSGDRSQPSQGGTDYWLLKISPEMAAPVAARKAIPLEKPGVKGEQVSFSAFPNPFTDQATIQFTLAETQAATVKAYDSQGRVVATLFQGQAQANQAYQVEWKASHKVTGMYLLQLQTPTKRQQYKVLLTR